MIRVTIETPLMLPQDEASWAYESTVKAAVHDMFYRGQVPFKPDEIVVVFRRATLEEVNMP